MVPDEWVWAWSSSSEDPSALSSSSLGDIPVVFSVLLWVLTGCFYALFAAILVRVLQLVCREEPQSWSVRKIVHCILLVPILARALDMTIFHDGYLTTPFQNQTSAEMVIGSLPGYTFFSTYSLLFCFWIVLYHQALGTAVRAPNPRKHMAATYAVANVLVYAVWAALEVAIACTRGTVRVDIHMAEVVFAVTVNIASAIIFWVYGTCVYNKYRVLANSTAAAMTRNTTSVNATVLLPRSKKALEIAQKIWRLTFIFTTVLAVRSIIIIADWFAPVHGTPRGLALTLALRVLFQALCELVQIGRAHV